jgi:hypothetical protein
MTPGNVGLAGAAATVTASTSYDHVFNDDLLMTERDLAHATAQFSEIIHVLDYPRLREKFAAYEKEANKARDRVRRFGFIAVFSAMLALLAVATAPLWLESPKTEATHAVPSKNDPPPTKNDQPTIKSDQSAPAPVQQRTPWTNWVALLIELVGMGAALIAAGGLFLGPWKRRWLESRLMTERLRQWHFQLMVRRGQQIDASVTSPSAMATFKQERDKWFDDFLMAYEGKQDAQLESLTGEPSQISVWLHEPASAYGSSSTVLETMFQAYRRLRFDHQYNYAIYKLRKAAHQPLWEFLKWPAFRQLALLSGLASFCFVGALVCAAVLVYAHAFGVPEDTELYVRIGAIALAIIAAALRTIQEGLGLDQEIERYSDYRGRTFQLRDRYIRTIDTRERLHLMAALELAAVDEMAGFLRTHSKATFVLQ